MVEANHTGLSPKMANLLAAQRNAVGGGNRNRPQSGGSHKRIKRKTAANQSSHSSQGSDGVGIPGVNIRRDSSAAPIQRKGHAEEVFKVMPGIKSPRGHKNYYPDDQHQDMNNRDDFDKMHELHRKKTMHRHFRSSGRASNSSCKAQGEIDADDEALDRAHETQQVWQDGVQAINDAAMNVAEQSGIDADAILPRQQTQQVETNVAFNGSFGVGG